MGRRVRTFYSGVPTHLTARGVDDQAIFRSDLDRYELLALLRKATERVNWQVVAWCLMTTHYHLLVVVPEELRVSWGMQTVNSVYAREFNARHRRRGHLFGNRFADTLVESDPQCEKTIAYILENPVRAGMVKNDRGLALVRPCDAPASRRSRHTCDTELARARPPRGLASLHGEGSSPVRVHRVRLRRRAVVRQVPGLRRVRVARRGGARGGEHEGGRQAAPAPRRRERRGGEADLDRGAGARPRPRRRPRAGEPRPRRRRAGRRQVDAAPDRARGDFRRRSPRAPRHRRGIDRAGEAARRAARRDRSASRSSPRPSSTPSARRSRASGPTSA